MKKYYKILFLTNLILNIEIEKKKKTKFMRLIYNLIKKIKKL